MRVLLRPDLSRLLHALEHQGYQLVGPVLREGAIVCDRISADHDFPRGWVDDQAPGRYRLRHTGTDALFHYAVGPGSFKRFLHPPEATLWRFNQGRFEPAAESPRYALIGARACDLAAIAIQDRVLLDRDPIYTRHRRGLFVVAVQCARAGDLCFCASMNSGPRAHAGFDLALTELVPDFFVEVGSPAGASLLAHVPTAEATPEQHEQAHATWKNTAAGMKRSLPAVQPELEHPRWKEVEARCLTCGNCTMVCPTCFCTTPEEVPGLEPGVSERRRKWDSCFSLDFTYLHGGSVRHSGLSRYRQWLTHKLVTWRDQFGTSGCVGCGRCIAWCPVGIDITEEARCFSKP